jgi:hypothetical protein
MTKYKRKLRERLTGGGAMSIISVVIASVSDDVTSSRQPREGAAWRPTCRIEEIAAVGRGGTPAARGAST